MNRTRKLVRGAAARRGSALILVLLMTLAVAALAVAAIFMSSSAGLLSRFYDRERQFAYAAESAVQQVLARLEGDSSFVVTSTTPSVVLDANGVSDASGSVISGAAVRVWAARTGDTTATGATTVSLLAQVYDALGTRFARRVDLHREHLGQFELLINESTTAPSAPFSTGANVVGRIHVNGNWAAINPSPTYRDSVSSAGTIGGNASNFLTAKVEASRAVPWPDTDAVLAADSVTAAAAGLVLVHDDDDPHRVEFVWVDDGDGVPERTEGFVRLFELDHGDDDRMDIQPSLNGPSDNNRYYDWDDPIIQNQCGAFYVRNSVWQFLPVATHRASWARTLLSGSGSPAAPAPDDWDGNWQDERDATLAVLAQPTARCFPAGSPYLVNTERFTNNAGSIGTSSSYTYPFGVQNAAHRYGGQDTTFTVTARTCTIRDDGEQCQGGTFTDLGVWQEIPAGSGTYLAPLDDGVQGAVVFATGDLRASGTVVGRVKLAVREDLFLVDRLQLARGPNAESSTCDHLFGAVAAEDIHVLDNAVTRLRRVGSGWQSNASSWVQLGGASFFELHGAYLSLEESFGTVGNSSRMGAPNAQFDCEGSSYSGGCFRHVGSAAMMTSRAFSTSTGDGFRYKPVADACLARGLRPPGWPASNRYHLLRAVDVRIARLIGGGAIAAYFATLQGSADIP